MNIGTVTKINGAYDTHICFCLSRNQMDGLIKSIQCQIDLLFYDKRGESREACLQIDQAIAHLNTLINKINF